MRPSYVSSRSLRTAGRGRGRASIVARREPLERERRVGGRAREARRRPELAHEKPRRAASTSPRRGSRRPPRRTPREDRRPDRRTGGRRSARSSSAATAAVGARRAPPGAPRAPRADRRARRRRAARALVDLRRAPRAGSPRTSRRLGVREREADVDAALPRAAAPQRRRAASTRLAATTTATVDERAARYCAIFTFSRAAACVTWPAIAVARSCAVAAERVRLLRREALAAPLLRLELRDVRPERVELALRLGCLLRVDAARSPGRSRRR